MACVPVSAPRVCSIVFCISRSTVCKSPHLVNTFIATMHISYIHHSSCCLDLVSAYTMHSRCCEIRPHLLSILCECRMASTRSRHCTLYQHCSHSIPLASYSIKLCSIHYHILAYECSKGPFQNGNVLAGGVVGTREIVIPVAGSQKTEMEWHRPLCLHCQWY